MALASASMAQDLAFSEPVAAAVTCDACDSVASGKKWLAVVDTEYKVGNARTLGQIEFLLPIMQNENSLLFADVRGQLDDEDNSETNVGLAYREIMDNGWIFGTYAFFDYKNTEFSNDIYQATMGVELLNEDWDFRLNGYLPDTSGQVGSGATASIVGNQVFINAVERAYYGIDYEVGRRIFTFGCNENDIRVFAGGYYFNNDAEGYQQIAGPRARIEARLYDLAMLGEGSRLTLAGEIAYDTVRETQGFVGARLRVPLSNPLTRQRDECREQPRLSVLERRMVDPIRRDVDIVANRATELALDAEGNPIHVVNSGENVNDAVNNAGAPDTVIVNGTVQTPGNVTLKDGQRLASGNSTLTLTGSNSGARVTVPLSGNQGVIQGTNNGNSVVVLNDNVTVQDLSITGGLHSVFAPDNSTNVLVQNNRASGAANHGFRFGNNFSGLVSGNTATMNGGDGFVVGSNNTGTISSNTAINNDDGFVIGLGNTGTISGNTARDGGNRGFIIDQGNGGNIAGNFAINNANAGFVFNADNTGTVSNNSATDNNNGFVVGQNNSGTFTGNSATLSTFNGITFGSDNSGTVSGNRATNGDVGFSFGSNNSGAVVSNFAAFNTDDGFQFTSGTGNIINNTANNNTNFGYANPGGQTGTKSGNAASGNGDNTLP